MVKICLQIDSEILHPGPDQPNMPVFRFCLCRLGAQAALIFTPFFGDFGPGSEAVTVHWRMGVLLGTSILYAFPVDGGSLIRLLLLVAHCSPIPHPF